jgi:hypothetical protein
MEHEPLATDTADKSYISPCPTKDCGRATVRAQDPALVGWTLVAVLGSGEPVRYYCSPHCANRGIARMHQLTVRPTDG